MLRFFCHVIRDIRLTASEMCDTGQFIQSIQMNISHIEKSILGIRGDEWVKHRPHSCWARSMISNIGEWVVCKWHKLCCLLSRWKMTKSIKYCIFVCTFCMRKNNTEQCILRVSLFFLVYGIFDIKIEEFRFTMTVYAIHTQIYGIVFAFYALHYENIRILP